MTQFTKGDLCTLSDDAVSRISANILEDSSFNLSVGIIIEVNASVYSFHSGESLTCIVMFGGTCFRMFSENLKIVT